ncbi:MAG: PAS domain-containing protein [Chloroflexi bacterium]|nr:PAS domain-containing protein [Chloroflexota bacterium]
MMTQAGVHQVLEVLIQALSDVVVGYDLERGIVNLFNPAAEAVFGLPAQDVLGRSLDAYPALEPLAEVFAAAGPDFESGLALPGGGHYRVRLVHLPGACCAAVLSPLDVMRQHTSDLAGLLREGVHALKTPLSSAKSFIELAEEVGDLNEKQVLYLERAQLSLESLLDRVHELLEIVWLESNDNMARQPTDLNELALRAVAQFESFAQRHAVAVELDLCPGGCRVEGDERRLEGAISNLVSNAIKYSPQGGPVHVVVECENGRGIVRVHDQGLGISPEHMPYVFDRFYRVSAPETRRIEGSGLGLAIVKSVVDKHRGEIILESRPGEGSVFGFSLPLSG